MTGSPPCWRVKADGASSGSTNSHQKDSPRTSRGCSTSCSRHSACAAAHCFTRRSCKAMRKSAEMTLARVGAGRSLRNAASTGEHRWHIDSQCCAIGQRWLLPCNFGRYGSVLVQSCLGMPLRHLLLQNRTLWNAHRHGKVSLCQIPAMWTLPFLCDALPWTTSGTGFAE